MNSRRKSSRMEAYVTADRKAAYEQAAQKAGMTLSEWICSVCDAALPKSVQKGLSERPAAHRPRTKTEE